MVAAGGLREARMAGEDNGGGVDLTTPVEALPGDDIAVVAQPTRNAGARRGIVVAIVIGVLALAGVVIALVARDTSSTPAHVVTSPPPTAAPARSPAKHTKTVKSVKHVTPPKKVTSPPTSPIAVAPPASTPKVATPPPTAAPAPIGPKLVATVSPASATVRAGTNVDVVLHVTNNGDQVGQFAYAYDGCPRQLVPPDGQICTQQVRTFPVSPGATVNYPVSIDTARAKPGVYKVNFDDGVVVTITIVK
jgi:hypothetical protein